MQRIRETLAQYENRVGITFTNVPGGIEQQRTKANRTVVEFTRPCGHTQSMLVKSLPASGEFCCTQCDLVERYREKELEVSFQMSTISCLACERWYRRTPETLTKGLAMFTCYCKLKRENERIFYDIFQEHFGAPFFRSFSGYGVGVNYSSDFHLKVGGKVFILHLNDSSHNNAVNLERDLVKLELSNELPDHHNIYIDERAFMADPDSILEEVVDLVENLPQGARHFTVNGPGNPPRFQQEIKVYIDMLAERE